MKPEDKKYILENLNKKSVKRIAEELQIRERKVRKFLETRKNEADQIGQSQPDTSSPHFFRNRVIFNIVLTLVFIIGIFLRIHFLGASTHYSKGDENFYVEYARYMAQDKGASIKTLIADYIEKKEWHAYPTPIRTGHIILSSLWMKMMNRFDNAALLYMSCFFGILSLFLGYLVVKRLLGEKIAFLSLTLFTVSPLNLALSKRALQDPAVYFFIILSLYLFYEMLKNRNIFWQITFMSSFFISIMLKETSVMLAGFLLLFIFVEKAFFNRELKLIPALSGIILTLTAALVTYIGLTGSVDKLIELVRIILLTPMTNPYVIEYQSGSFFRYLYDFFLISPATLVLTMVFLFLYITGKDFKNEPRGYLVIFFAVFYTIFSLFNKNVRAVLPLDFPIRIFSSIVIYDAFKALPKKRDLMALALIIFIALIDFSIFKHIFVTCDVYDPVTYNLRMAWQSLSIK